MTGHICPECGGEQGTRPGADAHPGSSGPTCACGAARTARQQGEDHRAARSAEMAAAEDFDPLRIRPYVTLSGDDTPAHTAPAADTTMPLFLGGVAGGGTAGGPAGPPPDSDAADETHRRTAAAYAGGGPEPVQPRRRRPFAALAVGAAVVAVVGTAAFAGGLFDRDERREEAMPEIASSIPDASDGPADSVSESPSASASPSPSRSASASPSASESPSASASESPSASPSATTADTTPSPSASAPEAPSASAAPPAQIAGPTLRRGDRGPEVAELQRRLQEIWVYREDDDGSYSDRVERAVRDFQGWVSVQNDPPGVYGPETRSALEARTTGEGRNH
ncbi:peptidoglycan-binding domain-containing protein [Streptomyces clavifer]|uniref:peptidoglycan-binding domain-containing protein n=1 Tax=Streptomyces TaxID=1883 RepID=UPI0006F7E029|nr:MULTISPECIES: peptidoglycan-binding domain-containing protein [Streptomyces]KQX79222.1 peptidoglycan-binding protein [Streptomyces sp. Root1319]KQZ21260.1 peptidoglycan-binding protein [Streptomyces sp. Root55]MDX3061393.1 peptidoglycan-binding domain-containing protein [Streptomyces sp. ND04-05B]RPK75535.1 putative peptidoglycan binding domain protein [Streptomyces sp. ADI97-07]WUC27621.1 peptidoglycan-binding protein [Streptomyces clavifer]